VKLKNYLSYLSILGLTTAWGLFLVYNHRWLRSYYIKVERIHISEVIYTCRFHYSPTPIFILLVLLPAIIFFALYVLLGNPALWKAGVEIGLTALIVAVVPLASSRLTLRVLVLVSIGIGLILGKSKAEKALLFIQGFTYGFVVLYLILGELAVSC